MAASNDRQKMIEETLKTVPRYYANPAHNEFLRKVASENHIVKAAIQTHTTYPFSKVKLSCPESSEAKKFYIDIARAINFVGLLKIMTHELMVLGEVIITFEGSWSPAKLLAPESIEISHVTAGNGIREHVGFRVDEEVRTMVLSTPPGERSSLLKMMDAYSIRQIEMGAYIDLTRSPNVKVLHPRRRTTMHPDAPRGVSYLLPIFAVLKERETLMESLKKNNGSFARLWQLDKQIFGYLFPQNLNTLTEEYQYLQSIVLYTMANDVFTPAATAKNFYNSNGPILPTIELNQIDLANDEPYKTNVQELASKWMLDRDSINEQEYKQCVILNQPIPE